MGKGVVFRVFPCDLNVEALAAKLRRSQPIAGVQATGLRQVGNSTLCPPPIWSRVSLNGLPFWSLVLWTNVIRSA